ncbi:LysM peptidoglycan-binding domain-containing protein [Patescibacteria group bacterium]|nr:LysM peptidoglycan-binding domain-containing protein [Patescibacteria group bacterium]
MILGALVIVVVAVLVVNYFKDQKGTSLPFLSKQGTEQTEQTGAKTHTVVQGENLWQIAEQYYGSGYNWVDIANANNIADANQIEVGQKLNIPDVTPKQATTTAVEQKAPNAITGATYTVVHGDNLWNIAVRAYGDGYKWVEIAKENKLVNPNIIHAGNVLTLSR